MFTSKLAHILKTKYYYWLTIRTKRSQRKNTEKSVNKRQNGEKTTFLKECRFRPPLLISEVKEFYVFWYFFLFHIFLKILNLLPSNKTSVVGRAPWFYQKEWTRNLKNIGNQCLKYYIVVVVYISMQWIKFTFDLNFDFYQSFKQN